MIKSESQLAMSKAKSLFVFAVGTFFGVTLCSFLVVVIGGGTLSNALKNYSTCLRLGAPEENCRNKYFLLNDR